MFQKSMFILSAAVFLLGAASCGIQKAEGTASTMEDGFLPLYPGAPDDYSRLLSDIKPDHDAMKARFDSGDLTLEEYLESERQITARINQEMAENYGNDWNLVFKRSSSPAISRTAFEDQSIGSPWQGYLKADWLPQGVVERLTPSGDKEIHTLYTVWLFGQETIGGTRSNTIYAYRVEDVAGEWLFHYSLFSDPKDVFSDYGLPYYNSDITLVLADDTNTEIRLDAPSIRPGNAVKTLAYSATNVIRGGAITERTSNGISYDGSVFEAGLIITDHRYGWEYDKMLVYPCYPSFTTLKSAVYHVDQSGNLYWNCHRNAFSGGGLWTFPSPKLIDTGWSMYEKIVGATDGVIYGIKANGDMHWYRHTGYLDGSVAWASGSGKKINAGWNVFSRVIASDSGVIYGIKSNGDMHWYKYEGYLDGSSKWSYNSAKKLDAGWQMYDRVYAAPKGVIYAVKPNGNMHWYRHLGYSYGTANWGYGSGELLDAGWNMYMNICPSSDGILYGKKPDGSLYWYKHTGYLNGDITWHTYDPTRVAGFQPNTGMMFSMSSDN